MLEVRYNKTSKRLSGWCGDDKQFGHFKDRGDEEIVVIDIPIPDKPLDAWLFDEATQDLIANPDYIAPLPKRDLAAEMDYLKVRVEALEVK
jgi:hypothetical protein